MKLEEYNERLLQLDSQMEDLVRRRIRLTEIMEAARAESLEAADGFVAVDELNTKDIRVVYQGVPGAYSHQAMLQYFGKDVNGYCVPTFETAMKDVAEGRADYAVLPVENTTGGAVGDVLDLQMKYDCFAAAEVNLPIRHVLLGLPGTDLTEVKTVYSHPQGIAQCQTFLEIHKDWARVPRSNTAASAKQVAEDKDPTCVAIASELAGELYGLEVLERNIYTNASNTTRFVVISGRRVYARKAEKISICFECRHQTGNLYRLMAHLTVNGLNMTRIESRPVPGKNFEYRFFVEFEGNLSDPVVRHALAGIRRDAMVFRILGNMSV